MTQELMQQITKRLPMGYACFRVLSCPGGSPTDLILLDANDAFEKVTGLKSELILNKKVSSAQTDTTEKRFDWPAFCLELAHSAQEQERHVEIGDRLFKTTTFFPEPGHIAMVFQDVTTERNYIRDLEVQKKEIESLTDDLEIIFNSTQDGLFLVKYENGQFRYIRNNAIHAKLTGLSLDELQGKTPMELLGEEEGARVQEGYLKSVTSGQVVTYEETLQLPGGKGIWLVSLTPVVRDEKLAYLVGSRIDVTELHNLQREKEELLQRLRSMFSEHMAVMLIIEPHSGKIVNANPAACEFYGYTRQELLQLRIQDINMMPQEDVEKLRLRALGEQQRYFLFPHKLKSGEIRMVDVYSCPVSYGSETQLFSIIFDVSDRERYREDLYREKELLSVTLHSIGDGVATTDMDGRLTYLNQAAEKITGWNGEEWKGLPFEDVFILKNEETGATTKNPITSVLKTGMLVGLENHTVLIGKQGNLVPIADSAAPIRDERGQSYGVVMVFRDIRKEREHQKQIVFLSYHDVLTGLHNRRFMEEAMKRLDVPEMLPLTVIMGDVNGLKVTNDVFGHEAGDLLLKRVAETFTGSISENDMLARWGGDEFLILMPNTDVVMAQKMIQKLNKGFQSNSDGAIQLSVSLGFEVKCFENEDLQHILQKAEEWMYHQKLLEGKSYRNNIINTLLATLYEKSMETEEHAKRLNIFCQKIADKLDLAAEEKSELSLLSMLHDIGKVGVKMGILQKEGPLTESEWKDMKRHPEIGYRIAQNTPELSTVAEYILSHHERWDGRGYPRGICGKDIPLLCRILAVADAFDAMTSDRCYRKALSGVEAKEELRRNAGTQFDPEIVEIFLMVCPDELQPAHRPQP